MLLHKLRNAYRVRLHLLLVALDLRLTGVDILLQGQNLAQRGLAFLRQLHRRQRRIARLIDPG